MRESRTYGSERGARREARSYRDPNLWAFWEFVSGARKLEIHFRARKIGRKIHFRGFNRRANIMRPPLKFEIRRAQLVSAGICGLKFKAAEYLALSEHRNGYENHGRKYLADRLPQFGRRRIPSLHLARPK